MPYQYQTEQDERRVVRYGVFHVQPQITSTVRLEPDYREQMVHVALRNVDRFESLHLEFQPDKVNEAALEQLVKFMLGESNGFLRLAPLEAHPRHAARSAGITGRGRGAVLASTHTRRHLRLRACVDGWASRRPLRITYGPAPAPSPHSPAPNGPRGRSASITSFSRTRSRRPFDLFAKAAARTRPRSPPTCPPPPTSRRSFRTCGAR